jgi:hypothetical protein
MNITQLDFNTAKDELSNLINLMINSIEDGASIGFLLPLQADEVPAYWQKRLDAIAAGNCVLVAAYIDGVLAGSAQLALEPRANGSHRAEVQKVMVHTLMSSNGVCWCWIPAKATLPMICTWLSVMSMLAPSRNTVATMMVHLRLRCCIIKF